MNARSDAECDFVYKGNWSNIVIDNSCFEWRNGCWKVKHTAKVISYNCINHKYFRYHKGIFTRISPTIGVEFLTKKIVLKNGAVVKAQIWDTSGSERYRSITTGHYRSAVGALLVFDLTDRESFESLTYWLNCLREHADENLVIALMGKIYMHALQCPLL